MEDNIIYKAQPGDSKLCGQVVLAMLLNVEIDDVCELLGKAGTCNKDIYKALTKYGVKYKYKRLNRFGKISSSIAVIKIGYKGYRSTQWTLKVKNRFYDPLFGIIEVYNEDFIQCLSCIEIIR